MSITISTQTQTQPGKIIPGPLRDNGVRTDNKTRPADGAPGDTVTLGAQPTPPATYGDPRLKPSVSAADLNTILAESESKTQQVMNLILPLIEQQSLNLGKVVSGEQKLNADPATIAQAKAAIADDGEFGVQQVADRILSFAKMAMGDDPSKLASFRAAVEDGFKQAEQMLGGKLPEISEKTRSTIMATFDQWEKNGFAPETAKGAEPDTATA